eukprot:scaffold5686_cov69-Isochrysis_galbana.AAC.1
MENRCTSGALRQGGRCGWVLAFGCAASCEGGAARAYGHNGRGVGRWRRVWAADARRKLPRPPGQGASFPAARSHLGRGIHAFGRRRRGRRRRRRRRRRRSFPSLSIAQEHDPRRPRGGHHEPRLGHVGHRPKDAPTRLFGFGHPQRLLRLTLGFERQRLLPSDLGVRTPPRLRLPRRRLPLSLEVLGARIRRSARRLCRALPRLRLSCLCPCGLGLLRSNFRLRLRRLGRARHLARAAERLGHKARPLLLRRVGRTARLGRRLGPRHALRLPCSTRLGLARGESLGLGGRRSVPLLGGGLGQARPLDLGSLGSRSLRGSSLGGSGALGHRRRLGRAALLLLRRLHQGALGRLGAYQLLLGSRERTQLRLGTGALGRRRRRSVRLGSLSGRLLLRLPLLGRACSRRLLRLGLLGRRALSLRRSHAPLRRRGSLEARLLQLGTLGRLRLLPRTLGSLLSRSLLLRLLHTCLLSSLLSRSLLLRLLCTGLISGFLSRNRSRLTLCLGRRLGLLSSLLSRSLLLRLLH